MSQRGRSSPAPSGSCRHPSHPSGRTYSSACGVKNGGGGDGGRGSIISIGNIGRISNQGDNESTSGSSIYGGGSIGSGGRRRPAAAASVCGSEASYASNHSSRSSRSSRSLLQALASLALSSSKNEVDRQSIISRTGPGSVCSSSHPSSRHREADKPLAPPVAPTASVFGTLRRGSSSSSSKKSSSSSTSSSSAESITSLNSLSRLPSSSQVAQPQWDVRASVLSAGFDRSSRSSPSVYALIKCTPNADGRTQSNQYDDKSGRNSIAPAAITSPASNRKSLVQRSSPSNAVALRPATPLPVSPCMCDRSLVAAGGGSSGSGGGRMDRDRELDQLDPLHEEMRRNLADAQYEYEECIYLPRSAIVYNAKPKDPPENSHLQRVWYHSKDLRDYMCSLERYMDELEECLKIHMSERLRKKELKDEEDRKLRHELDVFRTRLLFTGESGSGNSGGNGNGGCGAGERDHH